MATNKPSFLDTLFRRHARELRRFAHRRVGVQAAQDLVQEAFVRLAERSPGQSIDKPRAYLYRTVANLAANHLARENVRVRYAAPTLEFDALHTTDPDPESCADAKWRFEDFLSVLEDLPELHRHVFLLHKLDGLTYTEIATRIGISRITTQRYVLKALSHCAERMKR